MLGFQFRQPPNQEGRTAYLHSAIIQERYGMLKVWNVFLLLLTYFMTIFGTFLTRSGLISSVHSFARSDIGNYFVGYMIALAVGCAALLIWRLPKLKAEHKLQSLLSREFAFLFNNWILLFMMLVVLVLTTYPLATEFFEGEPATVGPAAYNAIMVPIGLILLCLMGVGPMVAWRKATGKNLRRALRYPIATAGAVGAGHLMFGDSLGFPALVDSVAPYDTFAGEVFAAITEICPVASTTLCAFVLGTIFQEFARGTLVRMRKGETWFLAFVTLMSRARRRYGGYIVHVGIALMYFGFTGAAYDVETEGALMPGESLSIEGYRVRYEQSRREVDRNKMAIYADLTIFNESGDKLGTAAPAKFIYHTHREMPTTEVSIRVGARDDLYLIMSTIDPASKRGTFRAIVRPLVVWIWVGFAFLLLGAAISLMPTARELLKGSITPGTRGARSRRRPFDGALDPGGVRAGGAARTVSAPASGSPAEKWSRPSTPMIALLLVSPIGMGPVASAQSSSSSSLHAGSVVIEGDQERILFQRTLCQCGDCARLPMDSCGCSWAENK
ncbi:MAG: cytochrome c-type biogenesis CcmF C-terminal domain-containing protein, partial [Myxococcota bacterium]